MTTIFISHAVADKVLADKFVSFLKEAVGVPADAVFCSSIDGYGIPLGDDFSQYMKEQIEKPKLVNLLVTPRYMESWFCLMELGATWAKSLKALPIVVPPIRFDAISSKLGLKQGWSIDDHLALCCYRGGLCRIAHRRLWLHELDERFGYPKLPRSSRKSLFPSLCRFFEPSVPHGRVTGCANS